MEKEGVRVQFKIDGPLYKDGIPLYETIHSLQEYHGIIDKSFLSLTNINKMSSAVRKRYAIIGTDFRRGSFESDLMIWTASTASLLAPVVPAIQDLNTNNIWDITKAAFEYLKALATLRKEGEEPKVNIVGDVNAPLFLVVGKDINVQDIVVNAAERSEPHYKKLSSMVEEGRINYIRSLDRNGEGIYLSEKERDLFNPTTDIDRTLVTIECNIYRFDKNTQDGKLTVFPGQEIPPGEYNFKPMAPQAIQYIHAMAANKTHLDVFKEIETHPSGAERIVKLHVIGFTDQRTPTLFDK